MKTGQLPTQCAMRSARCNSETAPCSSIKCMFRSEQFTPICFLNSRSTMKIRKCTLLITYACNLDCIYCYEKHKSRDRAKTMTCDTAARIIRREIERVRSSALFDSVEFNFFGGEPLLRFPLIRDVVEWAEAERLSDKCFFSATSNGTFVDREIMEWCSRHKEHFLLGLSLDGLDSGQALNRGCSAEMLPLEFDRRTWPGRTFKMTVSQESLPSLAGNVIALQEHGYEFTMSLAVGTHWTDQDAAEYRDQLSRLSEYYLNNRDRKPIPMYLTSLKNCS